MSKCVIEQGSTVTKSGAFWIVNGTRKIPEKVFATCEWVTPTNESTRIVVQTTEENTTPVLPQRVELPQEVPQELPQRETKPLVGAKPMENSEINELESLLKYAGDNVWLVALIFAFVLGKKYLDKKETSDTKLKQDLSQQCGDRHSDVTKTVANLEKQITETRENTNEIKVGVEHRLAALEIETKSLKKKLKEKSENNTPSSQKDLQ
jgi:hypothetical protein